MTRLRGRPLLAAAAAIGIACALMLAVFRAAQPGPPGVGHPGGDAVAGLVGFHAVYASPGLLALLGIVRGARAPLLAATVVTLPLAVTAFSGITFVLLPPGLLYFGAALEARGRPTRGGIALALSAAALANAAAIALFALTETGCWVQHADGSVVAGAPGDEQPLGGDVVSAGCGSGLLSTPGGLVALTLVLGALAAAEFSTRRSVARSV